MRSMSLLATSAILVFTLTAHGQPTPIHPTPPARPPMPTPQRAAPSAPSAKESQPTLLQVDAYQVETTRDQAAAVDLGEIGQGNPERTEILRRLGEFGTARLVMRFESKVDLSAPVSFTNGSRVPVVQNLSISTGGNVTPSVSYHDVGTILNISGSWREDRATTADLKVKFELSSVGKTSVEIGSGVRLPSFNTLEINQSLKLENGRPILIMTSDVPEPGDENGKTVLTLLNVMAQRLERVAQTRPAEEASAGPPAIVEAAIAELTGTRGTLKAEEAEQHRPRIRTQEPATAQDGSRPVTHAPAAGRTGTG